MKSHLIKTPRPEVDLPAFMIKNESSVINISLPGLEMDRRRFLKLSGLATSGLILAFGLTGTQQAHAGNGIEETTFKPNGYLQISPDGKITIVAITPEVGQGVKTAFPMVVAEELDVDWKSVTVEQSEINYNEYGPQFAGGSMGTPIHFNRLRKAGATARILLITAAAQKWDVPVVQCTSDQGIIKHLKSGQSITYAEISSDASKLKTPEDDTQIQYKKRKDYKILGKWKPGVDNHAIVTGKPLFGMDLEQPDLVYAVYVKCPSAGGKAVSANIEAIKASQGVIDAFILDEKGAPHQLLSGVAIIANSSWAAMNASNLLKVKWDRSSAANQTWTDIEDQAKIIVEGNGEITKESGDFSTAEAQAEQTIESYYQFPFIPHAAMEPMNCTAHYKNGKMEIWAPSQTPQGVPGDVEAATGIPQADIKVNQIRIGGGFGRKLINDVVCEAAAIAKQIGKPVKLIWSREQDMQHDFFRVGGFHKLKGTLDSSGKLTGWKGHFATFTSGGDERKSVRGGGMNNNAFPFPMLDNLQLQETKLDLKIPCGWWRAPGSCTLAWVIQSFLHELSTAAGKDHVDFLLELMGEPRWLDEGNNDTLHTGRAADVIRLAAKKGSWGTPLPKGHGRGIAFYFSHKGHFAEVAEVSVDDSNKLTLHKVVVAGDVGLILNKSGAENQIEGSVVDGYSSMVAQEITFTNGAVDQSNFHDISLLRMSNQPKVEIHMIESDYAPTGLGEPALPPLLPAVCNAIFDATGKRIKTLPLTREGFSV